jgi:hypothetical protein
LDSLPPEFFKSANSVLTPWITAILAKIWERGFAPAGWQECALVPVHKKNAKKAVSNYRGIAILPIVCKIMGIIILKRLVQVLDEKTPDSQCGFRSGRSTVEQIIFLRQVLEKRYDHKQKTVVAFLDFSCAFDSVDRVTLWQLLKVAGVPDLYVSLIRSMYDHTVCKVKAYGRLSDAFEVGTGVRQGDVLSPILFLRPIDYVIKKATTAHDGVQFGESDRAASAEYADDVALLGDSVVQLQDYVNRFQSAAAVVGLALNADKCKAICNPECDTCLTIGDTDVEFVPAFTYLGSKIAANGDPGPEYSSRIGKATAAFKSFHRRLWGRKHVSTAVKIRFYDACVLSTLLYGLNTVPVRRNDIERLEGFHRRNLRTILGFKLTDRIPNSELLQRANMSSIEHLLRRQRLGLVGHIARRAETRPARRAIFADPPGGWPNRGGGRKTWKATLDDDLTDFWGGAYHKFRYHAGFKWSTILSDVAADRNQWRIICTDILNAG